MDLTAPAYLREIVAYLRQQEGPLWSWFASNRFRDEHAKVVRLELLKATVRLDRETHAAVYAAADDAAGALGVNAPITLYQAPGGDGANAALWFLPGEVHIVLRGPVTGALSAAELRSLMGHELGHYRLWQEADGAFHIADQMLGNMACDPQAEPSHARTAHLLRLHAEAYADRASLHVTGALEPVVTCLVKVETGLAQVSAAAYVAQADEIFARAEPSTEGVTHPETFIRARALSLWSRGDANADVELRRMLEGAVSLDGLDLLGQARMAAVTRRLLDLLFAETWMRSDAALAHARLYFPDFGPVADPRDDDLTSEIATAHTTVRDYCCFVMLDFAAVDPALDDLPLAYVMQLAERMRLRERLEELANRELRVSKKALLALRDSGAGLLARAAAGRA
jgi:hypothetical protein